ncbi:MAG TPA: hypothetical protein VGK19_19575 [Capsulimonadaceae bacterium]
MDEPSVNTAQESGTFVGAVWPPPPTITPEAVVPFKNLEHKSRGYVPIDRKVVRGPIGFLPERGGMLSEYRSGTISVLDGGIVIEGVAVLPFEIQFGCEMVLFFVYLWLIGAVIFEVFRFRRRSIFSWEDVSEVVFVPKKLTVCFVYNETDKKGKKVQYSLSMRLPQPDYDTVYAAVRRHAGRSTLIVPEGRVVAANSAQSYSLAIGWSIVIAYFVASYVLSTVGPHI